MFCDFCSAKLPDWKHALTPPCGSQAPVSDRTWVHGGGSGSTAVGLVAGTPLCRLVPRACSAAARYHTPTHTSLC